MLSDGRNDSIAIQFPNHLNAITSEQLPSTSHYHVIVLSNFAKGFDKYSHCYDKSRIPESTYPDQFFVLDRNEISIGVNKAAGLIRKLEIPGNRLALLRINVDPGSLRPNERTGLGRFMPGAKAEIEQVYVASDLQNEKFEGWNPVSFEEAANQSLKLHYGVQPDWHALAPRSISFLPVAMGCQAKCNFCFSHSSISDDQDHATPDLELVDFWLRQARESGAKRAVITGGGEPGLLHFDALLELIKRCRSCFEKVVMITNGYSLANKDDKLRCKRLFQLQDAGLTVLSLSRHHDCPERNFRIMHLETQTERVIETWRDNQPLLSGLNLRLVCVLQKNGISNAQDVGRYVLWARAHGVSQVCFKELYVSTSSESVYHDSSYNEWSRNNQVPLKEVLNWAESSHCDKLFELPWGSPVFRFESGDGFVDVAAYTEPSVYWELNNGICRSWNVMSDGKCYASLEDRKSEVVPGVK